MTDDLHVSGPSRIMMPAYAAHAAYLGVLYVIDPQGRITGAPGLAFAREIMPMPAWGTLFLTLAAIMLLARFLASTNLMAWVLIAYGLAMVGWAGIYAGAVLINPDASPGGPAWPLAVSAACFATTRSVLQPERA